MAKPILKWAGGKRQILPEIRGCLPPADEAGRYHEPFFGGGALFFDTAPHPDGGTINDINPRLMNFYEQVRDRPDELIKELQSFKPPDAESDPEREFARKDRKGNDMRNYYYQQRELFNRRPNDEEYDPVEEAALLLYLNRTCYNGLYRENQSGEFNVPIGRGQSTPDWVQSRRIKEASHLLEPVEVFCGDFEYVENEVEPGDVAKLRLKLRHKSLDELVAAGLLELDRENNVVRKGPNFDGGNLSSDNSDSEEGTAGAENTPADGPVD